MVLEGILFDLDGTLANTLPVCIQAFQATVNSFCGRVPSEPEIYATFGPSEEGALEKLIPGKLSRTLPYFLDRYEESHAQCTQPFPGVEKMFTILKGKGIRTAIVTGKGPKSAEISMRILGLSRYVDIVESGFAEGANKPYSIGLVLGQWNCHPGHVAYVGDTPYDMVAARTAGLLPLGAAWAETSLLRQGRQPDIHAIFYDIETFIHWIEQQN